jgi:hypothetical protein
MQTRIEITLSDVFNGAYYMLATVLYALTINSLILYNNTGRSIQFTSYRSENSGPEKLSSFSKVTQHGNVSSFLATLCLTFSLNICFGSTGV